MNIHQSSAFRGCFNTLLKYEQNIYYQFKNLVDFVESWRLHAKNAKKRREQTNQTKAANALHTTISRHVALMERYNDNISYIKDKRFPDVINKLNALIVYVKPSPKEQQVHMLPASRFYCSENLESIGPDVVFSAMPVAQEACFNNVILDSEMWWKILTEFCVYTSFDVMRISWGKFKNKVDKQDKDVTFNNLYRGTIVLTLKGYFLIEWENKGWGKSWHEVSKLEITTIVSRTRRLRNPVTHGS